MGNQNCREQGRRDAKAGKYVKNHPGHKSYVAKTARGDQSAYNQGHKEGGKNKGKGGGCFLTTACTQYAGLQDDCRELQVLRQFRDNYVANRPDGNTIIAEYYDTAPTIISCIQSRRERNSVLAALFEMVKEAVSLIEAGSYKLAFDLYSTTFKKLKSQYGT